MCISVNMEGQINKGAVIVLVVLLMASSIALFFMFQMYSTLNPDYHEHDDDFEFTGTFYGEDCTGDGKSKYTNESAREHVYYLEYSLKYGGKVYSDSTGLIFGEDDQLIPDLFTKVGISTLDDVDVTVYERSENGVDYTYYIAEKCTLLKIVMESSDYSITGVNISYGV